MVEKTDGKKTREVKTGGKRPWGEVPATLETQHKNPNVVTASVDFGYEKNQCPIACRIMHLSDLTTPSNFQKCLEFLSEHKNKIGLLI